MTTIPDAKNAIFDCFRTEWMASPLTTGIEVIYPGENHERETDESFVQVVWNPTIDDPFTIGDTSSIVMGTVIFQIWYWHNGVSDTVLAEGLGDLIHTIFRSKSLTGGVRVRAESPMVFGRVEGYWRVNITANWQYRFVP